MPQTGYTPIQLYRSATASATPSASDLQDGELAINTNDGKLFFKNSSGNVTTLVDSSSAGTVTSVGGTGAVNGITLSGTVTTSGNLTLGGTLANVNLTSQITGTLPVANGGTNLTAVGTAGQVLTVNSGANGLEYTTPAAGVSTGKSIAMAMLFGF